jgi:rod shape-determining protein MreC
MARVIDTQRSRLLLGALVCAHLIAISRQVDTGGGVSLLERFVFVLLSPVQRAFSGTLHGVSGAWSAYVDLRGVHDENARLKERTRLLETQLQVRQQLADEASRLREVLALQRILPLETVPAEVTSRDGMPWFRTLVLNKGQDDGVALDAPVLSPTGVVGRVIAVSAHAAKVQILLDRDAGVGVLLERTRVTGVVSGQVGVSDTGPNDLVMKYVSTLADVATGDVVVTSGLDRLFPKGLVVGRVRSVLPGSGLFKEILVSPSAQFDRLEEVLVVKRSGQDPAFQASVR